MEATSGVVDGLLALPDGGGAVRGIGERFQPDRLRGTGNYAIGLKLPAGPGGIVPRLSLRYSTGQGNGAFGMGWQLVGPLDIRRRTDRGIPRYRDDDEFVLAGADTLVDVGEGRYRPRSDTQCWLIRREGDAWTIRTKEGRRLTLGSSFESRIADGPRIFGWLVDSESDVAGNRIEYRYERDGNALRLAEITWGIYALRFVHEARPDPVHDARAGFPVVMTTRCAAIERHCPGLAQPLATRYALKYDQAEGTRLSLLTSVRLSGFDDEGRSEDCPPLTLGYSGFDPSRARYLRLGADDMPPPPLDAPGTTLVDLNGDGLPDVLETRTGDHRFWPSRADGTFGSPRTMPAAPTGVVVGQPGVTFADLDGDGAADLVRIEPRVAVAVRNGGDGTWAPRPEVYAQPSLLRVGARDARLVDLDGDGVVDLLESGPGGFIVTYNRGRAGWSRPESIPRIPDAARFPDVRLDDPAVELMDMTGDGLSDIVYCASGRVEYWPNLGRGRWGARVRMRNAPVFPAGHDPARLHFPDIDGDGLTDILYVDFDRVYYWFNQGGRAWSERYEVPFVPPPRSESAQVVDMLGNGTRGLLWSTRDRGSAIGAGDASRPGAARRDSGYRYLDLNGGVKPYLLTRIDDGLGGTQRIEYTTAASLRAADDAAGRPWESFLPFPLHVVSAIEDVDGVTGRVTTTRMRYHRGCYDGADREFRGFERVEMVHDADEHTPAVTQETVFFLGTARGPIDAEERSLEERARDRALSGSPIQVTSYEVSPGGERTPIQSAVMTWSARREFAAGGRFVHFPHVVRTEARDHAPGEPDRIDLGEYEYDDFGNVMQRRRTTRFADEPQSAAVVTETIAAYTGNEDAWLVGLPAEIITRDADGAILNHTRNFYDGPAFTGLPLGEATAGLLRRTRELVVADAALPPGYAEAIDPAWGLTHETDGFYRDSIAYDHDAAGNVTSHRDALGVTRTITYDADALFPVSVVDADGRLLTAAFDPRCAQPIRVVTPDGIEARYRYAPTGRLQAKFDTAADGTVQLTQFFAVDFGAFDLATPRPARTINVRMLVPGVTFEELAGAIDPTSLPGVNVVIDHYDSAGNRLLRTQRGPESAEGAPRWIATKRRTWTRASQPAADFAAEFAATPAYIPPSPEAPAVRFEYDSRGRVVLATQPDGARMAVRYGNRRIERRDARTADSDPPTVETLDALGQLIAVAQPDGAGNVLTTRYLVDVLGRTTQVIDASGRTSIGYLFAGPGPAIRIEHADAGARTYWRDANQGLRAWSDSLGRRVEFEYDALGRMVEARDATDPAAITVARSYSYAGSRLVEARDSGTTIRFDYDGAGRVARRTVEFDDGDSLAVNREFGLQSELRALTYPDGTRIEYGFDASESLRSATGFVEAIEYEPGGNPTRIGFAGGASVTYAHDPSTRRMTTASLLAPGGLALRSLDFSHDPAGNVAGVRDVLPEETLRRTFAYDGLSRLARAQLARESGPGVTTAEDLRDDHYAYSPTSDLVRNDEALVGPMSYDDVHTGRLARVTPRDGSGPVEFTCDDAGRVSSFGRVHRLEYDVWDRIRSATLADGTVVRFAYDYTGARVRKSVTSPQGSVRETRFVENLYEQGPGGARINVFLNRLLVARRTSPVAGAAAVSILAQTVFLLTDHLGSVLCGCDATGTPVHQQLYSPFGLGVRAPSDHDGDDRFIGLPHDDELGLSLFGARYYAPWLGRFLTPDWFIIENPARTLRVPEGLNAYGYAINNPMALRDPSGLWFGMDDLIVAGIGFGVGFIVGTITGLAQGKGFGSLLMGLEAGLCGAAGAWLAYATAGVAVGALGALGLSISGGLATGIGITAAIVGGLNGVISGSAQIYDWGSPKGWLAFLADSSWGLVGTALADILHTVNLFYGDRNYVSSLSRRQNRHVYDGGFGFGNFAFTSGNVTSNLNGRRSDLVDHESLHILQSRLFGPIYQVTYAAWMIVGLVSGLLIGIFTDQPIGTDIEDMAYANNPWEMWAYDVGGSHSGGDLAWT